MTIHPTAIVEDGARLAGDVSIGPYCVVGRDAELGGGVELISHVAVAGRTRIGPRTLVWPFASIGHQPQDLKFRGEPSTLEIGADCMIREGVTVNPGTTGGGLATRIGAGCLLMAGSHVAHDCRVGDKVVLANNAILAGHVEIGDFAILGGNSAVHQFVRIGAHAIVGGMSGVDRDVIPFGSALGNRAYLGGLNMVGLKRRKFGRAAMDALRAAYRMIFEAGQTLQEGAHRAGEAYPEVPEVRQLVAFIQADSSRSFCTPKAA
ncbi:MAG TPA: acyl-ACP--UDP-N-acetylglucosamine O-acyltransferase [Thermohalobaculum sp.]|nr:acyl-ACP--UDP-N-acetylglucosamine O-acyltransferase [Thermohalobaculum sp.]